MASSGHATSASKRFLIYKLRFNCLFQLWEDTAKSLQVTAKGISLSRHYLCPSHPPHPIAPGTSSQNRKFQASFDKSQAVLVAKEFQCAYELIVNDIPLLWALLQYFTICSEAIRQKKIMNATVKFRISRIFQAHLQKKTRGSQAPIYRDRSSYIRGTKPKGKLLGLKICPEMFEEAERQAYPIHKY